MVFSATLIRIEKLQIFLIDNIGQNNHCKEDHFVKGTINEISLDCKFNLSKLLEYK